MPKILGLDLGTNSLGWAIVDRTDDGYALLDKGVDIFQEGVAREKNNEVPAVQTRTEARALRRHYFRRRLRKIALLRVLVRYDLCPALTDEALAEWRSRKSYPLDEAFLRWQRTNDDKDENPYRDRYRALTETLDLGNRADRHTLGRALYHLAQRRGFLSNRKDANRESEEGVVKKTIKDLSADMADAGCRYLGEYFYQLYLRKTKIRKRYTSRNEHVLAEFRAICERQRLPEAWCKELHRAIFFQRPLKSQKGAVGRCTFEKRKSRCPVSHPRFEEFRMLAFINNIRIATPDNPEPRQLNSEEIGAILPLFRRKTKPHFDFEEIARKIAGRERYACKGDWEDAPIRFNFSRTTTVSGCPVTAALADIFGSEWSTEICSLYTLGAGKSESQIVNDVWHALFSFVDEERLRAWAQEKLQLPEEQADKFAKISLSRDYAALSLNAIDKILPYLRANYRYDEAVFIANLKAVLPAELWADEPKRRSIEADISQIISDFRFDPTNRGLTKEQCVGDYLRGYHGVDQRHLDRLYHPSMIETYRDAQPDGRGILQLGSPRTPAVRNPMAMRALFRLRILVNELLREGKIDRATTIRIEFSRGLNNANKRKAIEQYQREREAEHRKFAEEIRRQYAAETGMTTDPTEDDVLKYRLWEEQKHVCPYTGRQIRISDFIGSATAFDIEHTVPRARGGDDSQMNKTLCEKHFNRDVKRAKLPAELSNHADILTQVEWFGWREKVDSLEKAIAIQVRKGKSANTKQEKDNAIQRRHYLQMQLDYWRGKLERFTMTEVPEGFSNRQGVDIGIIGRYARLYLKTVFGRIHTVKGATTADFRKAWGLQEEYAKKERVNHVHHCIDAITIACIGHDEYLRWTQYVKERDCYDNGQGERPQIEKPWPTFTEDVKAVADELLVSHHTPDNMPRQSRKRLRKRGKVQFGSDGKPIYLQGDTARGALHMQTFYGAIERDGETKYVVRKSLDSLQPADVDKIVDETVKRIVQEAIAAVGFKTATNLAEYTIWMNEEKGIPIRKVRIFTPSVTDPVRLKQHRDLSDKAYKRHYYVKNESNYCMAIYEGADAKGRTKRSFEIVSNLEAAQYFKASADRSMRPDLVPLSDESGYPLKYILKTGTMVLFYEKTPEELYECTRSQLVKRLYKVITMSREGRVQFLFHQEARDQKAISEECGNGASKFYADQQSPKLRLSVSNFNMLVEGYDFELTVSGELKFKRRPSC